jgi:L-aminopeptidase/D-esterase-like protein
MITRVPGVRVGHWTDARALTGCTAVLPPPSSIGSVFVAGGAPATHETDLLAPGMLVEQVHAVMLCGGSAFGLAAAAGAVSWCEEHGLGLEVGPHRVPIVPAAGIFDLSIGDAAVRPGPREGYEACASASPAEAREGNVGAGCGATVGKGAGPEFMMKGGLGGAAAEREGLIVAAIAVVNSWGDVVAEDGTVIAGARSAREVPGGFPATTLACVATSATLTKEQAHRVARMGASGLARAVRPAHTMFDGDVVFALATCASHASPDLVGALAADVVAEAVRRGVRAAEGVPGVPAAADR